MIVRHKTDSDGYQFTEVLDHDAEGQPMASRIPGWLSAYDCRLVLEHMRSVWTRSQQK